MDYSRSGEDDCFAVFRGNQYPLAVSDSHESRPTEQDFTNVESQVERVDFNFFDEFTMMVAPQDLKNELQSDQIALSILPDVFMQEEKAYALHDKIFTEEANNGIQLEVPQLLGKSPDWSR